MPVKEGSDEIFQFIHALSAEEKGYFKKYAKRHSTQGGKLLQLFDAINVQAEYNDAALKKMFQHLPVLKAQLFEQIMDALLLIDPDEDAEEGLWKKFKTISLLHKKGLLNRALKMNEKATEHALRSEVFPVYERLLKQQFGLRKQMLAPSAYFEATKQFNLQLSEIYAALEKVNFYYYCFGAIHAFELESKGDVSKDDLIKKIPELKQLLATNETSKFYIVQRNYLSALAKYYYFISDSKQAMKLLNKIVDIERKLIAENNPAQRQENYYFTLNGLIYNHLAAGKFKDAEAMNEQTKIITFSNKKLAVERDVFYAYHKLIIYLETKDFKGGEAYAAICIKQLQAQKFAVQHLAFISLVSFKLIFEWINGNFKQLFKSIAAYDELYYQSGKRNFIQQFEWFRLIANIDGGNTNIAVADAQKLAANRQPSFSKPEQQLIALIATLENTGRPDALKQILKHLSKAQPAIRLFNLAPIADLLKKRC